MDVSIAECLPRRPDLAGQQTHLKAALNVEIHSVEGQALYWGYQDALEGEAALEGGEIQALFEGSSRDAEKSGEGTVVHHHHDHSCRHHHRDAAGDRSDAGASLLVAVVLTVFIIGIVILAASAAESQDARCTLSSVPEPSSEHKQRLAERLDRLLSERLVKALETPAPEPRAPPQR